MELAKHRDRDGLYLLTGSQKFELMGGVSESMSGRITIVELHSLSLAESEHHLGKPISGADVVPWLWRGGYPELVARDLSPRRYYADYVATYVERDVRQIINVRDLRDVDRFLRVCALRTGQLLSMNSLASDVGKSPNTIRAWLAMLKASNVVRLVQPFIRNLGKRLVKTPKLYFDDVGLACFLCGLDSPEALRGSALLGPIWETAVLGQLVRCYANRCEPLNVYFYADHWGTKVDFVIPQGEKLWLYECKWFETPETNMKAFVELERLAGNILSRSLVTPRRGRRVVAGVIIEDAIDLAADIVPEGV